VSSPAAAGTGIVIMAKEPVPGRVKTRLCPPCNPSQAAGLARACLVDTTAAAAATVAAGLAGWWGVSLAGEPGDWLVPGGRVMTQRGGSFDERLAWAGEDAGRGHRPFLLVGADTPQLTPPLLGEAVAALARPGIDAVLGPADDGGYWVIGLRRARRDAFVGVPMSSPRTGAAQRDRLESLGLRFATVAQLADVDTMAEAMAVAEEAPDTCFARHLRQIRAEVGIAAP